MANHSDSPPRQHGSDRTLSTAKAWQDLRVEPGSTTFGSAVEMEILVGNASPSPAYGHGHHQVLRGEPLFIPALNDIRKAALAHAEEQLRGTYEEVRKVDHRLQQARGHGSGTNDVEALQRQRKGLLDRLAELVPRFDQHIAGEVKMQQLHNYTYSRNHGLATTHFMTSQSPVHDSSDASESWLMLESLEAVPEGTLTQDRKSQKLDDFAAERVNMNGGRCHLQNVYERRPMTLLERQWGAVRSINGVARPIRLWVRIWRAMFVAVAIILVIFFGVGLIASTQEQSPVFLAHYFTFAVAWSLSSSALLGWYIKILGGTRAEIAAGILAMMGLWLVMMQIGQTRRAAQTDA